MLARTVVTHACLRTKQSCLSACCTCAPPHTQPIVLTYMPVMLACRGDCFQLGPIAPPTTLYSAAMNEFVISRLPEYAGNHAKLATLRLFPPASASGIGTQLFVTFKIMRLTEQVRCGKDAQHAARLQRFRDPEVIHPIDKSFIADFKVISPADVAAEPGWLDAIVLVGTNNERAIINHNLAQLFAARNGVPFITWQLPLSGSMLEGLSYDDIQQLYAVNEEVLCGVFVEGFVGYVTNNISTPLKIANGSKVLYHSLSFDTNVSTQFAEVIREDQARIANWRVGMAPVVRLNTVPHTINVSIPDVYASGKFPPNLSMVPGAVVVPIPLTDRYSRTVEALATLLDGTTLFGKVKATPHALDLGQCVTVNKVQSKTCGLIVANMGKRASLPRLDTEAVLVILSRCTEFSRFRVLPLKAGGSFDHLLTLRQNRHLRCFMAGYDTEGVWRPALALAEWELTREDADLAKSSKKRARTAGSPPATARRRLNATQGLRNAGTTPAPATPRTAFMAATGGIPAGPLIVVPPQQPQVPHGPIRVRVVVGPARLVNAGNTCFMNSQAQVIDCLLQ